MAFKLKQDYIYSLKPSPTDLASLKPDQEKVRRELRKTLRICRDNCVKIIMKDNHTLGKNPKNLTDWVRIVREEI